MDHPVNLVLTTDQCNLHFDNYKKTFQENRFKRSCFVFKRFLIPVANSSWQRILPSLRLLISNITLFFNKYLIRYFWSWLIFLAFDKCALSQNKLFGILSLLIIETSPLKKTTHRPIYEHFNWLQSNKNNSAAFLNLTGM